MLFQCAARRLKLRAAAAVCESARHANGPALLFCQQQLSSHLQQPILETAGDHAEHTRQLDLHRDRGVEDADDTGDGLTHGRDGKDESVALPTFAASAGAAGHEVDDLREAALDAAARLGAAELV